MIILKRPNGEYCTALPTDGTCFMCKKNGICAKSKSKSYKAWSGCGKFEPKGDVTE